MLNDASGDWGRVGTRTWLEVRRPVERQAMTPLLERWKMLSESPHRKVEQVLGVDMWALRRQKLECSWGSKGGAGTLDAVTVRILFAEKHLKFCHLQVSRKLSGWLKNVLSIMVGSVGPDSSHAVTTRHLFFLSNMKFSSSGDCKPIAVAASPTIPEQRTSAFMDLPVEIHQRIIAEV